MTKGAIKMFTREAAVELAKYKITVNYITLGACRIERKTNAENFGAFNLRNPEKTRTKTMFPLGRIVHPKDVGDFIVYLSGKESEIITGVGIRIDGGSILL
jgi:NAD(P)-dependent dehydrogenase (short-subunit alcohol dehydrogenase family)